MPGYLPPQGYKDPYKDSELTYRASLLPIGTYADPNGGHDTLGMAWPGAITEPMNALLRLIGTPSQPGTFAYGPDVGIASDNPVRSQFPAQEDMRTLLETFLGGNATRGMGAGEVAARALSDTTPSLPGAVVAGAERNVLNDPTDFAGAARRAQEMFPNNPIYNRVYRGVSPREKGQVGDLADGQSRLFASTSPDVASTYAPDWLDNGAVFPLDMSFKNPMTVDAGGNIWDQIPFEGKRWSSTDDLADIATQRGHDGLVVRNVVDNNMMGQRTIPGDTYVALKRGTVTSPLTGETLFSDNLPSLPGAVIAGAERNAPGFDVWHGSPHDFDKFDISKIGTGEGAQGFGHGLYFSENPSVAKDYQSSLSNDYGKNTRTLLRMTGSPDAAREWLAKRGKQDQFSQDILSDLNRTPSTMPGYLYQAHINADPKDFLDWNTLGADHRAMLMTPSGAATFGAPGWSYLDSVSRGIGEGTRNYVITDPNLINVIHKWRGDQQLYSDQLPSLWGAAVQGQQNKPYPNSLFGY